MGPVMPPANVLVAVALVAVNESAVGLEVATTLPLPSVERSPQGIEVIASDEVVALSNVAPPVRARPPVIVVVASVDAPAERDVAETVPPENEALVIDPPVIEGLVIAVPES